MDKRFKKIFSTIEAISNELERIKAHLEPSKADRGGVEVAIEETPYTAVNHIYILCRRGELPHYKVGRLYEFSRSELRAWKNVGCPQPAQEWAEQLRTAKIPAAC